MAKPNKTVAAWIKRRPIDPERQAAQEKHRRENQDPFFPWFFDQVQKQGRMFASMDEARAAYDAENAKRPAG